MASQKNERQVLLLKVLLDLSDFYNREIYYFEFFHTQKNDVEKIDKCLYYYYTTQNHFN